ncbi:hypothetical protein ACFQZ2_06010 [Streptomonospora algeriensis]|uniref:DUF4232 domain-containing protein n=1 Tax=Streptomonospora algeriensis TaxID=995084 RepID=A0ABW3BBM3_9ACTN
MVFTAISTVAGVISMVAGVISMATGLAPLVGWSGPADDGASGGVTADPVSPPIGGQESEAPRVIVGPLGDNSRCGRQTFGPEQLVWRVCAGVAPDSVSFGLLITNNGSAPVTVATYLEYVQTGTYLSCPEMAEKQEVAVAAGEEVVVGDAQCSVPREDEPFVYQGRGWVAAADATSATIKKSPNAHVHPDGRSSWDPDIIAS